MKGEVKLFRREGRVLGDCSARGVLGVYFSFGNPSLCGVGYLVAAPYFCACFLSLHLAFNLHRLVRRRRRWSSSSSVGRPSCLYGLRGAFLSSFSLHDTSALMWFPSFSSYLLVVVLGFV